MATLIHPTTTTITDRLVARLNAQQRAVVTAPDGHALVLAGAGTGKTTTLVHRVSWLIEQGVAPSEILLLTFTRQAAEEMQRRAAHLLHQPHLVIPGGTFHGWAHGLLRRYGSCIGLSPKFTPLNDDDASDMLGQIRAQYQRDRGEKLPAKHTLSRIISKAINLDIPLAEVVAQEEEPLRIHLAILELIARDYRQLKRAQHLVDYDDLLVLLRQLLTTTPQVRECLAATYRHILVDEYQDTNGLQVDLVAALAGPTTHVMVVGDDGQSIYGFRGADVRQIRSFCSQFEAHSYRLEENYRSSPSILHIANHVLHQSTEALPKTLVATRTDGPTPTLLACANPALQATAVTAHIQAWLSQGIPAQEIAVLFRASHHVHDLELMLNRVKIPFEKRGGITLQDLAHVKDLVSYLRVIHNPADSIAWRRLLLMLPKIGTKTCERILSECAHVPDRFQYLRELGDKYPSIRSLHLTLNDLRTIGTRVVELLNLAWGHYNDLLPSLHDDVPRRQADLQRLMQLAEEYQDLETFLGDLTLDGAPTQPQGPQDRLVLSTIHSAKGLEWRAVIVVHVAEGIFPAWRNLEDPIGLDEDLRLLYVAITRAKDELLLTYPSMAQDYASRSWQPCAPSRFVNTIPVELLKRAVVE